MGCEVSIGNGVAKELICMTHGHEQWGRDCLRNLGGTGCGRGKGGKIITTVIALSIKYVFLKNKKKNKMKWIEAHCLAASHITSVV